MDSVFSFVWVWSMWLHIFQDPVGVWSEFLINSYRISTAIGLSGVAEYRHNSHFSAALISANCSSGMRGVCILTSDRLLSTGIAHFGLFTVVYIPPFMRPFLSNLLSLTHAVVYLEFGAFLSILSGA